MYICVTTTTVTTSNTFYMCKKTTHPYGQYMRMYVTVLILKLYTVMRRKVD